MITRRRLFEMLAGLWVIPRGLTWKSKLWSSTGGMNLIQYTATGDLGDLSATSLQQAFIHLAKLEPSPLALPAKGYWLVVAPANRH